MLVGIDHVILASRDPEADINPLVSQLGLTAGGGGQHAADGTFNRLAWLGDSYVELMGVFDGDLARASWWGRWVAARIADELASYAGLALATDEIAADVERLREMRSPISDPIEGERVRPDGDVVRWRMARLPEPDPELGLMFLIEHDREAAEWRPADRAARAGEHALSRVSLPVTSPGRVGLRLLRELGIQFRPSLAGAGARDASIGAQTLRLVSGRDRPEITITGGAQARSVDLGSVRLEIRPR